MRRPARGDASDAVSESAEAGGEVPFRRLHVEETSDDVSELPTTPGAHVEAPTWHSGRWIEG